MTEEVSKEQIKGENGTGIDEAKRLKEKKGANMVVKILAIVLVPLIAIAVIAILALNSAGDRISDAMMKHELAATEYALEMSLNNSAPGDFSYENGALYKGELNLTDNKQVLDALKQNAGVDVALFWGSDLAVTNLTGGTITLSEKVASKVLGGESYFSNSLKLGDTGCYAYLAPLKNTDGTVVGILAACMPVREVNALYKGIVTGRAIAILILVAAFCVSTFIVVGMISKALLGVVGNLDQIAEGKLNFKVPDKLLNRSDEVGKSARAVYSVVNGFSGIIRDIHNSMLDMNEFTGTFTSNFDSIGQSISSVNTAGCGLGMRFHRKNRIVWSCFWELLPGTCRLIDGRRKMHRNVGMVLWIRHWMNWQSAFRRRITQKKPWKRRNWSGASMRSCIHFRNRSAMYSYADTGS